MSWLTPASCNSQESYDNLETPKARLGINLSGPADWNSELPFLDAFRLSRPWISQREGAEWGKGPELSLDEHGWVQRLEAGCFVETTMMTDCPGAVPLGQWTVLYQGRGTIQFSGASLETISSEPGKIVIHVKQSNGFFLQVRETDASDYIREIQVLPPGITAAQVKSNPWNPRFLSRWQGMSCLRFMDFAHTNNSNQKNWSQRPKLKDATWAGSIPIEMMCDLANRLSAEPWFCIPHEADDEYVTKFASLVKKELKNDQRVWVEYSNEVWNGQFAQHRYAADQGLELGFAKEPWEAAWRYTAHRSVEIFKIWERVFGGTKRLCRVLPSQAANSYVSEQICSFNDAFKQADCLAIAPYISFNITPGESERVIELGLDGVLQQMETSKLKECIEWMQSQKMVADNHNLKLVCYEAGQHMVGIQGAENNDDLTKLFQEANKHPRMGTVYTKYLNAWKEVGGDVLCAFSSVSNWSKWGSWGMMQHNLESITDYPKFEASLRWAAQQGQKVTKVREQ